MKTPKTTPPGVFHAIPSPTPLNEASDRLEQANDALNGFILLLCGYNDKSLIPATHLASLLEPIRMEVAAALDELNSIREVA